MKTRVESTLTTPSLTFSALLVLLVLTFALAKVDLGAWNTPVGLFIASVKASLVLLYFMKLRHSGGLHRVAAGVGIFWLGILFFLCLTDYLSRGWLHLP